MSLQECQITAEKDWIDGWKQGPTLTRWDRLPVQIGDQAPDASLEDLRGMTIPLSSSWTERPVVVLFWRQYGCGCGRDRNTRLKSELDDYTRAGADVVIVGQGRSEQAADYKQKYDVPVEIFSDPDRAAYRAFGVLEGTPSQIFYDASQELLRRDFEAGLSFAKERREMGRAPVNSPWQLPAEFVIDTSGVIRLAYRYQYCEDFPDPRVLSAAISECLR